MVASQSGRPSTGAAGVGRMKSPMQPSGSSPFNLTSGHGCPAMSVFALTHLLPFPSYGRVHNGRYFGRATEARSAQAGSGLRLHRRTARYGDDLQGRVGTCALRKDWAATNGNETTRRAFALNSPTRLANVEKNPQAGTVKNLELSAKSGIEWVSGTLFPPPTISTPQTWPVTVARGRPFFRSRNDDYVSFHTACHANSRFASATVAEAPHLN